ncbi:MAG: 1-deoxy-D-xylulose-5-phosphate synthase [Planctomycetes bacterium]|nr:1-deoxy-D-xylulose-5-phosphate synthase [Planctomycetota bacterium]
MAEKVENAFGTEIPGRDRIREMSPRELGELAEKIRRIIIDAVDLNGGHLASNLGVVELTMALHMTFDFTKDRLVFDVGHQAYPHKILTGRAAGFEFLRNPDGVSGFTNPEESPCDVFTVGHAGTAISTAAGLATAYGMRGERRKVVAVIGDAAMQNGMSLEAMNHAGSARVPLLVVLNDNEMGISPTVGAISGQISRLRSDRRYLHFKDEVKAVLEKVPVVGAAFERVGGMALEAARRAFSPGAIFELMGFRYYGPVDGHDIDAMTRQLEGIKDIDGPVMLHVITRKGYGDTSAEDDPTAFHSARAKYSGKRRKPKISTPECRDAPVTRQEDVPAYMAGASSYSDAFGMCVKALIEEDDRVVAISAAMTEGTGLGVVGECRPGHLFDVGIAEGHAVGFAAGLAAGGMKPIVAVYSTFMQRAVDQVFQELYLQKESGVIMAMDRAGVVGGDGATHQGAYDVVLLGAFPGIVQMAPRDGRMLDAMLRLGLESGRVCAVRYPKEDLPPMESGPLELELGKAEVLRQGDGAAILAYGAAVGWAMEAADALEKEGCGPTVVDIRFAWPLDMDLIEEVAAAHKLVLTVEDGIIEGGAGRRIAGLLAEKGVVPSIRSMGIRDARLPHAGRKELLEALGLNGNGIADMVRKELK